jgi:hypothetical protein
MNIDLIPHLADCIDLNNPYAQKYIELISTPDAGDDVEGHHIVPAAFYKYVLGCEKTRLVSSLDMVPENIVQLSKEHHIMAHYYLARCIKHPNNIFTDSQIYAFVNMFSKRIMKKHPLFEEMVVFADENKGVKRRYKQYDLCPPTIPTGCSFYQDAIIHTDRTGAWITQIRDHGKEHYTYDHFGNCLDIQIEGLPCVFVVRSLSTGRVVSIASNVDEQYTYIGFSEAGDCYFCHDWQGRITTWTYRVDKNTYKFADAMYKMSNYISQILPAKEFSSFMSIIKPYVGKHSSIEPVQYYDIPTAPKRMFNKAHCDDMVKQCETSAETWLSLYNDGIRPDGMEAVTYYKKLADIWRNMDADAMANHPNVVEPKQVEPIVLTKPNVSPEETPITSVNPMVQNTGKPAKIGFIRRLLAKLF